ncbi:MULTISPECIES: phasin family protein [Azonexaceae]|uniref:phasin family protein n=1 Tax=Azonexaceae TaxID=2008795 RepID=UPI001CF86956|nr:MULTISPECIES: phasin family protein [Azonexaceae]UCV21770.1 phasin family protein [Ferribacterium limneticum]
MSINPEQFAAANKAAVDSLLSVANTALASAERIASLNLETARSVLEDSVSGAKALMGAKDPQEALSIQASLTQPSVEKAVAYSKSVYEISTETQEQLAKMVEAQFSDFQKNVAAMLEKAAKSAPAGSDVAVAAVQSAIAAANSAFDNMRKTAKQVTDMAQTNMAAATSATTKAVKKATTK